MVELDLLEADRLLAPALGQQHLRRTQLVDHVDRLVGEFAVVDVASRQLDRGFNCFAGVFELVVVLEIGFQPLKDLDRVRHRRLVDVDLLEAAHQRAVLLEVLPIFLVGGRADTAQRARRQRRLQQVRRVHRAAGRRARADHGVDLVDEHDRAGIGFELLDHLLEAFLEVAAVARTGEQGAHVEREHGRALEHVRHLAVHDAARQAFCDRGLADAGVADEQRIVFLAPAQDLDGPADLGVAANQRIDLALTRLAVEIDAISLERVALLLGLVAGLGVGLVLGAAHRTQLRHARPLGDAVADVVDRVVAGHVLLLQEIGGVALALCEDRDQHVGARHLLAARRLHVDDGALDHALEPGGRLRILVAVADQVLEFQFQVRGEAAAQLVEIDIARPHHRRRVLIVDQGKQEVLERGIFMVPLVGERQCAVERLFEAARKSWHLCFL